MNPSHPSYLRVVRASAWCDLVVTAGFATPWTYELVHTALSSTGRVAVPADRSGLGHRPTRPVVARPAQLRHCIASAA